MDIESSIREIERSVAEGVPGVIAGLTDASETRLLHAEGTRRTGTDEPMSTDTVLAVHSVTKSITAVAALQCVDDGLLDLDAPASETLPALGQVGVLLGFDDDGAAITRPASTPITARMLMTHTSGFGYDLFDPDIARLARSRDTSDPLGEISYPLLHDPGERWTYGVGIDWLGLMVAELRGQRLDTVFRERILAPCGMGSTSFDLDDDMRGRLASLHRHRSDGEIRALDTDPPTRAAADLGGQGLFSTVPDLLAYLRMWLNDGDAPNGRVLSAETARQAAAPAEGVVVTPLTSAIGALARDVDFFGGAPVSWAHSLLRVDADLPGRRRAGSLSWAGLANVHFWIDRATGIGGVWGAQLLPWFDPLVAEGFERFERAAYAD